MNTNENMIQSYDAVLDAKYGDVGSESRDSFRKEAYAYYMGQVIKEARKEENLQNHAFSSLGAK